MSLLRSIGDCIMGCIRAKLCFRESTRSLMAILPVLSLESDLPSSVGESSGAFSTEGLKLVVWRQISICKVRFSFSFFPQ